MTESLCLLCFLGKLTWTGGNAGMVGRGLVVGTVKLLIWCCCCRPQLLLLLTLALIFNSWRRTTQVFCSAHPASFHLLHCSSETNGRLPGVNPSPPSHSYRPGDNYILRRLAQNTKHEKFIIHSCPSAQCPLYMVPCCLLMVLLGRSSAHPEPITWTIPELRGLRGQAPPSGPCSSDPEECLHIVWFLSPRVEVCLGGWSSWRSCNLFDPQPITDIIHTGALLVKIWTRFRWPGLLFTGNVPLCFSELFIGWQLWHFYF